MKLPAVILALCALLTGTGCVSLAKSQLEGKLPRVDAQELTVDVSTLYGVSGTLHETNVRWNGDAKTVGSSELRITSPAGTYHRTIKGAGVSK
jgi:hypothetical protein